MLADWTAPLTAMKVPRFSGRTAEVMSAMPGIMRAFISKKKLVDTSSTPHSGTRGSRVVAISGTLTHKAT